MLLEEGPQVREAALARHAIERAIGLEPAPCGSPLPPEAARALPATLQDTRLIVGTATLGAASVTSHRVHAVTLTSAAILMLSPAAAQPPLYLSANPPKAQIDSGPSLSLGRVGLDPCPDGFCRPEPQSNLFYFMTKGTHPIEPVPGIVFTIPFGGGGH